MLMRTPQDHVVTTHTECNEHILETKEIHKDSQRENRNPNSCLALTGSLSGASS